MGEGVQSPRQVRRDPDTAKTMTEKYELSRRKTLAGLATIGAAGAGAGLGTSALFSDTESFQENTITAGTLDMSVTATIEATNEYWSDSVGASETADGEPVMNFDVSDVKPGDWGIVCFTVDIGENPGYVTIHAEGFEESENGLTEPEGEVDESSEDGELDEALLVTYWDDYDDSGDRAGLSSLDNITNAASNQRMTGFSWQQSDEDGVVNSDVEYTNFREFYFGRNGDATSMPSDNDPLGAGFASGDGILVGGTSNPTVVGDPAVAGNYERVNEDGELEFCLLLDLPQAVGNEIQGDSLSFDLRFSTEQVRNNGDARSGRWDGYTGGGT